MPTWENSVERSMSLNDSIREKREERLEYLTWCIMKKIKDTDLVFSEDEENKLKTTIKSALEENISTMKVF